MKCTKGCRGYDSIVSMCRNEEQRVWIGTICIGKECRGCDNGQYVQEWSAEGITGGSMCRIRVQRVWQGAVCAGDECGRYDGRHFAQKRSLELMKECSICSREVPEHMTGGSMCRRVVRRV